MKISHNPFSGRFTIDEVPGMSFPTRKAAEMYAENFEKRHRKYKSPSAILSFTLEVSLREKLIAMAKEQDVSLSKLIRSIVEKGVNDFGRQEN